MSAQALRLPGIVVAVLLSVQVVAVTLPVVYSAASPMLLFSPVVEFLQSHDAVGAGYGNVSRGEWNTSYTEAVWPTPVDGKYVDSFVTKGDPYKWTNGSDKDDAPSMTLTVVGTYVKFVGQWGRPGFPSQGSVGLKIDDGEEKTASGDGGELGTLIEAELEDGPHTVQLIARGGTVSLFEVITSMSFINTTLNSVEAGEAQPVLTRPMYQATPNGTYEPNPALEWVGNWEPPRAQYGIPVAGTIREGSSITQRLGTGNVFLRINGSLGWNYDHYTVTVRPDPPGRKGAWEGYAYSPWPREGQTLFACALSPIVNYTVTVENTPRDASIPLMEIELLELWKGVPEGDGADAPGADDGKEGNRANPTNSNEPNRNNIRMSAGVIAGAAIGGVIGGLLLALAIVFCCLRRRAFTVDEKRFHKVSSAGNSVHTLEGTIITIPSMEPPSMGPPSTLAPALRAMREDDYPLTSASNGDLSFTFTSTQPASPASTIAPARSSSSIAPASSPSFKTGSVSSSWTRYREGEDYPGEPGPSRQMLAPPKATYAPRRQPRPESVTQESDAGHLEFYGTTQQRVVPPSYNPNWASSEYSGRSESSPVTSSMHSPIYP